MISVHWLELELCKIWKDQQETEVLENIQNLIDVGTNDTFHMLYNSHGNGFDMEQGDIHEDIMTWNESEVDEFNHPEGLQDCRWFNYVLFSGLHNGNCKCSSNLKLGFLN